ncbi:cytochrome c oxidase assembly protein COX18, mitochondrial isoform X2 [Gracilinanus agilis]|uniref:cytochrome c oxidase assembly protein COX18, mitochondrial isoform X2 n=1 Tax=Gracilinanus agilis TaxID=191870 RepID=UPI001CFD050E|nr:cytochrome c oxidase assembly protein COX18, mitochondrial isoform X2 [Gracilinanus agilis]
MFCGSRQQLRSRLLPALLGSRSCTPRRGEPLGTPGFLPVAVCAYGAAAGPAGVGGWYETLAASAPAHWAEAMLLGAQGATGLPWWASIVVTTTALRSAVTLPLAAYQHYVLAKVENLQPEIKIIAKNLNCDIALRAKQLGWSKRVARLTYLNNMRRIVSELYIRDNCHPFKATLLVWIQIPMWVFMSVALRNFSLGITVSEDFCITKTRNVPLSEVYHTFYSWNICVDDSHCCNCTLSNRTLLVLLQFLRPFPEPASALPRISPILPHTNDKIILRHSL